MKPAPPRPFLSLFSPRWRRFGSFRPVWSENVALVVSLGVALLLGLLAGTPAAARQDEDTVEEEPPATILEPAEPEDPAETPARHALVLLMDNQRRVLDAGPGVASLRMMAGTDAGIQAADPTVAASRAQASLEITGELVEDSSGIDAGVYLTRMQQSQERTLELMQGRAGSEGNPLGAETNGLMMVFAEAARGASALLPIGAGERQRILLEYRSRIESSAVAGIESSGESFQPDFDDGGPMPSAAEIERKKEKYAEWLAENERREREMKRRRAERAERLQQRSKKQKTVTAAPSVGLTDKAKTKKLREKPDPVLLPKMEVWHIRWSTKSDLLKKSLGSFQKLDLKRHTTKSIGVCRQLYQAVVAISGDEILMKAPDPQIREDLGIAMGEMQQMAHACSYGKFDETREHRETSRKALRRAVTKMKVYGLAF